MSPSAMNMSRSSSISIFMLNRAKLSRWLVGVEVEKQRYSICCRGSTRWIPGEILIDGIPTSEVALEDLRRHIAIVPQDTILFDGTVMENIIYGAPTATREGAIEAAKQANAHDFIIQMPKGYETQIGESGAKLSTGQQQRLSIARALLKGPPILVLDEATSALDSQSEVLVQASLENLMKGRTTFVIAHRLSTVVHADKILVLNGGEIVENGTHQELLKNGGLYQKLCQMQFRG